MSSIRFLLLVALVLSVGVVSAFAPTRMAERSSTTSTSTSSTRLREGNIEQIEFKIYPDGRVEETVRGVKGDNCHKVTEKINESLGKVVASEPTEELYEQELVIDQTVTETLGDSSSGTSSTSGDSWDGSSSW